eukprot:COSAG06_NODE_20938_length_775_cov_5.390533_2_plen_72_part_00
MGLENCVETSTCNAKSAPEPAQVERGTCPLSAVAVVAKSDLEPLAITDVDSTGLSQHRTLEHDMLANMFIV